MLAISITFSEFTHAHTSSTSSASPPAIIARYKLPDDLVATTNASTDPLTGLPTEVQSKMTGHIMCLIPPGVFLMGAPASSLTDDDESPCRPVFVSACYLSKGPVSNAEYEKHQPQHRHDRGKYSRRDAGPATRVSWDEAREFCDWMSKEAKLTPGSDDCYRLATEAEAEKAIRGGMEQELYPWGNAIDPTEKAICSSEQAADCDQGCVNGLGFRHPTSDVFYWLGDWYAKSYNLKSYGAVNPRGPPTGKKRTLRGQTWYIYGMSFRCSDRWEASPDTVDNRVGMRVVRALPVPADLPIWTGRPTRAAARSVTRLAAAPANPSTGFCIEQAYRALQERARAVQAPLFTWPDSSSGTAPEDPPDGFYCQDLANDPSNTFATTLVQALSDALADEAFLSHFVVPDSEPPQSYSTNQFDLVDGIDTTNYATAFQRLTGYVEKLDRGFVMVTFVGTNSAPSSLTSVEGKNFVSLPPSQPPLPTCAAAKAAASSQWDTTPWSPRSGAPQASGAIQAFPPMPGPGPWAMGGLGYTMVSRMGKGSANLGAYQGISNRFYVAVSPLPDGLGSQPPPPRTADGQLHFVELAAAGQVWVSPLVMGGDKLVFDGQCPPLTFVPTLIQEGWAVGLAQIVALFNLQTSTTNQCAGCKQPKIYFTQPANGTNLTTCVGITNILECLVTLPDGTTPITQGQVTWADVNSLGTFSNNVTTVTLNAQGKAQAAWIPTTLGTSTITAHGTQLKDASNAALTDSNTTNVTANVIAVDSVEFKTFGDNTPLDNNPGGVGLRIFPDKKDPADTNATKRVKVLVEAKLTSAIAGIPIYFKSFDVDDATPIAIDPDSVIDDNGLKGDDNNGSPKAGSLSAASATTDASGVATVELTVTMQPGDNFRVAAACRPQDLTPLVVDDSSLNFYVPGNNNQVSRFAGKLSPLLTVWRALWVERDSMAKIPTNKRSVLGSVDKASVGTGPNYRFKATFVLYAYNRLPDKDEFEGGKLEFRLFNSRGRLIQTIGGFTVVKSKSKYFGGDEFAIWPALTLAQIVAITSAPVANFQMSDDDDYAVFDTPHLINTGAALKGALADAFVEPRNADIYNTRKTISYIRHLTSYDLYFGLDAARDLSSARDQWTTLTVACFEPDRGLIFDPDADGDPDGSPNILPPPFPGSKPADDNGGPLYGVTRLLGGNVSAIFIETLRDYSVVSLSPPDEQHVASHEIGHTIGNGVGHPAGENLMNESPDVFQTHDHFRPAELRKIRSTAQW